MDERADSPWLVVASERLKTGLGRALGEEGRRMFRTLSPAFLVPEF